MATQAQIEANKRNAQKSTGPKTHSGKATVAQNAVKHGLFTNKILIKDENPDDYQTHRKDMLEDLAPVGALETILAERIIHLAWRLFRLNRIQSETFDTLTAQTRPKDEIKLPGWEDGWPEDFPIDPGTALDLLEEGGNELYVETMIPAQITYQDKLKKQGRSKTLFLDLGRIAVEDFSKTRVLERLLMYERRIENSLFKSQQQLQQLQCQRKRRESQNLKTED
ncbi:MAG: hypothetical protein ACYTER_08310 [Planctomycetota bacterium]|jgi:hypothetical protein